MDAKYKIEGEAPTLSISRHGVKVSWVQLGEGLSGDYTGRPDDIELLRFDVYVQQKEWMPVDDASYCTLMPANTKPRDLIAALHIIHDDVVDDVLAGMSIKKKCERLSWISPLWVSGEQK